MFTGVLGIIGRLTQMQLVGVENGSHSVHCASRSSVSLRFEFLLLHLHRHDKLA